MLQRRIAAVLLFAAVTASAAAPKAAAPKTIAPAAVAHPIAMFLRDLSSEGKQRVTFRAAASGQRFFFEEPAGVTVYAYDGSGYRKEAFLKSSKLETAMKRYGAKP